MWMQPEIIMSKQVIRRQISYGITYTWNLKHDTVKLSMKQKQTHRHREQTAGCQGGTCWWKNGVGGWG